MRLVTTGISSSGSNGNSNSSSNNLFVVVLTIEFPAKFRIHVNSFLVRWIVKSHWQVHSVKFEVFRAVVDTLVLEYRRVHNLEDQHVKTSETVSKMYSFL